MKVVSICGVPARRNWRKALVHCVGPLVAVAFLAAGQFSFAELEELDRCHWSADSYLVLRSDLEYTDVSDSYATSINDVVRQILRGFLASSYRGNRPCLFLEDGAGQKLDLADHVQDKLLNVHCKVTRVSSKVLLVVRIDAHESMENLLSFETSAPFFEPNVALQHFAVSFPRAFAGQVVREYSYTALEQRFDFTSGVSFNIALAGNIVWNIGDLENDLNMTEGVPANVMQSVGRFRTRQTIENTAQRIGALTFLGTAVAILILWDGLDSPELMGLSIACGAGLLTAVVVPIEQEILRPTELLATLNRWLIAHTSE